MKLFLFFILWKSNLTFNLPTMKKVVTYNPELIPEKWTPQSLCYDLKSAEDIVINPQEVKVVKLWIKTNFAWRLYSRSSLPLKKKLMVANWVWIIDEDYRNEAWVILYNFWTEPVEISFWERLCQMEIIDHEDIKDIIVDHETFENWAEIEKSERQWWFGSTWGYSTS